MKPFSHIYSATLPPLVLPDVERDTTGDVHEAIIITSRVTCIGISWIMGDRRTGGYVRARALAVWLMYIEYEFTFQRIAEIFGKKSHAFALHLYQRCDDFCKTPKWAGLRKAAVKMIK
jgi:chromosomal replication initiation ATPase DnaA